MWSLPWSPWASWSSQDKEPEEVKKQTKVGEGQRSQRGVKYYQRNRSEEKSANLGETEGMYKRKVKPPGGAKRASGDQQQGDGAELDDGWQVVQEEELQALANVKARGGSQALTPEGREMAHLGSELMAGSGPASTLSTDSGAYHTPPSSLSEQDRGVHRGLVQPGSSDSGLIMRLQEESIAKDTTIRKLQLDVNQLQKRLEYAEQLEKQNLRLTTEESKHEQEKQLMKAEIQQLQRKASVSRPYTRGYAHEQKLQEMLNRYERQYNEQLEENSRLQEKISQLEKGMCEDTVVTHIDDVGDSDLKVELKKKEQHIHALQTQVQSLQQHSKGQSRQVLQLKQELEALKATGEEVDQSWREMVDQLEGENRKLSLDVGGLHRDKQFLEKSMQALKVQLEVKEDQLGSENRQLTEQIKKLSGFSADLNTLVNTLQTKVKKLEKEKETLQTEVQVAKTEKETLQTEVQVAKTEHLKHRIAELQLRAELYKEDFTSERRDREVAHGKIADHEKKYAQDVGELKAKLVQMEEDLHQHKERLADVEQLYQRREKEMRSVLEEASRHQQEVQAKTSQVKQYKKQVDTLKDKAAELQKHNEDLIQEMDRVMTQLEKAKPGKPKKKPSDADEPSKVAELESKNKELMKEKEKLFKELDKTRKELEKKAEAEKAKKKEAEKVKKEAKKKLSDKGAAPPDPTGVSMALEEKVAKYEELYEALRNESEEKVAKYERLYEALRNENEGLREELKEYRRANMGLKKLLTHGSEPLLLPQSRESSESPMTPVVDLPRAIHTGQQPPRILEEDEEIEQEKIKQTLDMQFHKERQSFQSMEEQTSTAGAGTLSNQAIPKARVPEEYAHGRPPSNDFAAQFNRQSGADIGPSPTALADYPQPHPPKPRLTPPTMSPSDPEMRPLPQHASGPSMRPPRSQQIPRAQDHSHLGATGSPPRAYTDPLTQHPYPLASQYGDSRIPYQQPVPNQRSTRVGLQQPGLHPRGRQGDQMHTLRSPVEHQHPQDQRYAPAMSPTIDPNEPQLQQSPHVGKSPVGGNRLDESIDSIIHAQAESVETEVGDESSHRMTLRHVPYDPNLTCPLCDKRFRYGEIQKYRLHVNEQCTGSRKETVSDV